MKQVVKELTLVYTISKFITADKFYGVQFLLAKGLITKYNDCYFVVDAQKITTGVRRSNGCLFLQELIEKLLDENILVYEFDTFQELATWLTR